MGKGFTRAHHTRKNHTFYCLKSRAFAGMTQTEKPLMGTLRFTHLPQTELQGLVAKGRDWKRDRLYALSVETSGITIPVYCELLSAVVQAMPKWFNTAGPCQADIHYMLSPLDRLPNLERLVAQRGYFVIHAPRQTGKTTAMLTLGMELKVWREGRPDPLQAGLEQLDRYLAGLGLESGWLVIFDQRPGLCPRLAIAPPPSQPTPPVDDR
jgi:hypothetical protein